MRKNPWRFPAALIAVFLLATSPLRANPADEQQTVNDAVATIERMKSNVDFQKEFQPHLEKAKAALIFPTLYKGGFILGGQYGNGVFLTQKSRGDWSYPAFYTMSGASLGLQIGVQGSSILFMIMTDAGLNALMKDQFKFGADAGVTFFVAGAGVNGSSTTAAGADIIAFSYGGVGLYGGISLEGTIVSPRESWNERYYGQRLTASAILLDNQGSNPYADRLRDILSR